MKRRWIGIVAAALLALLGTLVLVGYVQAAKNKAVASERLVSVLVVDSKIDKGTASADIGGKVKQVAVPANVKVDGAVASLDELKDLSASVDLLPGEQVTKARFVSQGDAVRGEAPAGLLQVTVPLDPERALGGNIRTGDTVGVLLSFDPFDGENGQKTANTTHLELHKVLVTNVQLLSQGGTAIGGDNNNVPQGVTAVDAGKYLVTLALDAPAVEQVVFAGEHGFIWLSAEPKDANEGGTKIVTRGNVYTIGVQ
jgi:pilus assembly protein CpaB